MAMTAPSTPAAVPREAPLPLSDGLVSAASLPLVSVAVAVAVSLAVLAALVSALSLAESLQTTLSGTSTPEVEQIFFAYSTAASLPASSHPSSRQHAMPSRKFSLPQMHLKSNWPHPAMPLPVVYLSTQGCYRYEEIST